MPVQYVQYVSLLSGVPALISSNLKIIWIFFFTKFLQFFVQLLHIFFVNVLWSFSREAFLKSFCKVSWNNINDITSVFCLGISEEIFRLKSFVIPHELLLEISITLPSGINLGILPWLFLRDDFFRIPENLGKSHSHQIFQEYF